MLSESRKPTDPVTIPCEGCSGTTTVHNEVGRCRALVTLLVMLVVGLSQARYAAAQAVQLRIQEQPYYVGEPVVVQVEAKFSDDEPATCRLLGDTPPNLLLQGPEVSTRSGSYTQIINGRIRSERTITYAFNYVLTASQEGPVTIGPFEIEHGGQTSTLAGATLNFEKLDSDPDMQIQLSLGSDTFYVGQRVPVTIRWSFAPDSAEGLQYAFQNLQIRSPLFDQFEFEDEDRKSRIGLKISTASGPIRVDATESQEVVDGKTVIVLTAQRKMMATSVGEFRDIPVSCRTKRGTQWRRSFFGTEPRRTAPAISAGEPLSFTVKPLPTEDRPASFTGAVGSGYSMDVSANRSVVRVGDPISLTVSLRGEGLETMSLPDLSVDGGMSPARFQLPNEPPAGSFVGNTKQFKVNVRVKDESVDQIPALAFSWFDPKQETYVTTRSKPIALQVMPAQVVSASDVVSATRDAPSEVAANGNGNDQLASRAVSTIPQGANLGIERDPARLLSGRRSFLGSPLLSSLSYVAGIAMVLAAVLVRRRREIDPVEARRQRDFNAWRRQISQAADLPGKQSADRIASALRNLLPLAHEPPDRDRLGELISECENLVYAPTDQGKANDDLVTRALRLLDHIKQG